MKKVILILAVLGLSGCQKVLQSVGFCTKAEFRVSCGCDKSKSDPRFDMVNIELKER